MPTFRKKQRAIAQYKERHDDVRKLYEKVTFQLNDTHPTVAVAELGSLLLAVIIGIAFIIIGELLFKKLQKGFAEEF